MPRRDGHSGRIKISRKKRKRSWLDASKQRSRTAKMKRGGKHHIDD